MKLFDGILKEWNNWALIGWPVGFAAFQPMRNDQARNLQCDRVERDKRPIQDYFKKNEINQVG